MENHDIIRSRETNWCYYLCPPVSFLITMLYFILGIVSLVENFELCSGTSLWWYNLVSFILIMFTVIYIIIYYIIVDDGQHIIINNKGCSIIINLFFCLSYIIIVIWGITQVFYIPKNCFDHNSNIILFGFINILFEFIIFIILSSIFIYFICLYRSSKINPRDNMDNV